MSIGERFPEFKGLFLRLGTEYFAPALIVLVGFAGFGLGRLSVLEENRPPIRVLAGESARAAPEGGGVVASKNGAKYHLPWCSGAARIAEENRVWFASAAEARRAGYEPAANCPGIE